LKKKNNNLKKKLSILFDKLNIKKNENLVLHSNSAGLLQFKNNKKIFNTFYNLLKKKIGKKGSIAIPTYNYNFTKTKYFDYLKSKSNVGMLSNFFLKKYPNRRTINPIFSHTLIGKKLYSLIRKNDYEILGENSIFSFFEKKNFKIVCFCCQPSKITFLHYLEKKNNVSYRYDKIFRGKIKFKKFLFKTKIKYYVGKKNIDYSLKDANLINMIDNKNFIEENFGRFSCYSVNAKYLSKVLKKKLKKTPKFLIND